MLTQLYISSYWWCVGKPILPAGFLGGTAPCLQAISLSGISYSALPTILLSTSNLVKLDLSEIPPDGYISPEAMVASLATLPRLEIFIITFQLVTSRPDRISSPPETRTILPALTFFEFKGASEYLEDLVGRIDGPHLKCITIVYFYHYLDRSDHIHVAQLSRFIDRSVDPTFAGWRHAEVSFSGYSVTFSHLAEDPDLDRPTIISYGVEGTDAWGVAPISRVLSQFPSSLSNLVHLQINCREAHHFVGPGIEWLHFLRQFSTVQTLLVYSELGEYIFSALDNLTEVMVTEVLPSLELLCLEENDTWSLRDFKFVTIRQQFSCPVTVVKTEKEFRERLESYISK